MSAFSMPFAEPPRPPLRVGDIFSNVMGWDSLAVSTQSIFLSSREKIQSPAIIAHPFGAGVSFDSPARPVNDFLSTPPHILREMQSFESGLTARQVDPQSSPSPTEAPSDSPKKPLSRSPSISSIRKASPATPGEGSGFILLPETSLLSRYSTDVFDVLQTYRGLPRLDKLSPWSPETTVIKMSLEADDSAVPRDDPRFVIWGEFTSEREQDDFSISQGSFTDLSSSTNSSIVSRKRSTKGPPSELSLVRLPSGQKVIVAATIERWIAQLTGELNYDELLIFFLTYRTYITAVDLCHLLICRFHWALGQHSSPQDERVRRIVRVRTFVAIRYWLLTFFVVDFLPNRELRLLVAEWLNTLGRDPILKKHNDGLVSPFPYEIVFDVHAPTLSLSSCLTWNI
jgi:GDP/GTP exchange factor required for growth at low temperature